MNTDTNVFLLTRYGSFRHCAAMQGFPHCMTKNYFIILCHTNYQLTGTGVSRKMYIVRKDNIIFERKPHQSGDTL